MIFHQMHQVSGSLTSARFTAFEAITYGAVKKLQSTFLIAALE